MAPEITTSLIAAFGSIALASASYWFTKKQEREAALREQKLTHYKDFVVSLNGVISGESTPDGQRAFAKACNNLNLIAPMSVIAALQAFQQKIKVSNSDKNQDKHNALMSKLFYELRKDLGVSPLDDPNTFRVGLWSSGVQNRP